METNNNNQNSTTKSGQASPSIQDRIGEEKTQEIANKVQSSDDKNSKQTVVRSSEIEDATYPKEPEVVTNKKFTYGD